MEKLTFNSNEEIFDWLSQEDYGRTLVDNGIIEMDDLTDNELEEAVGARGYYYFESETDIENYVEDVMGKYVFDRPDDVVDWAKENSDDFDELTTSASVGMYRSDCIELINKIVEEHGWEWFHRRLELM
jgi:hypothetical protein